MRLAYLPGDSFFHRLDPTAKLVWNFLVAGMIVLNLDPVYGAAWWVYLTLLTLGAARVPLGRYGRAIAVLAVLGALLALGQVVYNPPGTQIFWQWGLLRVTRDGLWLGAAIFFRILALASLAAIFTLTTEPARLVESLIQVARVPYRLAYTVYAGLRFLPLAENEAQNIRRAHLVRGVGANATGPLGRLRLNASLALPLLVSALRRARAAAIAMDSRAFGAYAERTVLRPARLTGSEVVFVAAHALLLLVTIYLFIILGYGHSFVA